MASALKASLTASPVPATGAAAMSVGKTPKVVTATLRAPKTKCCTSRPKCNRCPLRMLAEGTLPEGYTVKKRRLVDVYSGKPVKKRKGKKKARIFSHAA